MDAGTWRSALYPQDWTPAHTDAQGRFLHDVSYAGYRAGESLPDPSRLPTVDAVLDHGADPSGNSDSTGALQSAIDAAEALAPARVWIPAGLYRVDGTLDVAVSGVVLQGAGAGQSRLAFTRATGMTDASSISLRGHPTHGAHLLLVQDAAARATGLQVADASSLTVGDDVALGMWISPQFVTEHAMDGVWGPFNGTYQVFARRTITAVDTSITPHHIELDVPLRSALRVRDQASVRRLTGLLSDVGVQDLGLSNAVEWNAAWSADRAHVLALDDAKDAWVLRVSSFASPFGPSSGPGSGAHLQSGGIILRRCLRVTLANCRMERAQNRGGGGNGYLFEVLQCNEILTRDCVAVAGRHNFIQNWGFGTSGCVWLRCHSSAGLAEVSSSLPGIGLVGLSEYHHSLATGNLVDGCTALDGWGAVNRGLESSGAGHSATECVFWNHKGAGVLRSQQFGRGYVIGTSGGVVIQSAPGAAGSDGTAPPDEVEGAGQGAQLDPPSLYEDQFRRRTGRAP